MEWADDHAVVYERYRALQSDIDRCGKCAWIIRNTRMCEVLETYDRTYHQRIVLGQPDSPFHPSAGTRDCLAKAMAMDGVTVLIMG